MKAWHILVFLLLGIALLPQYRCEDEGDDDDGVVEVEEDDVKEKVVYKTPVAKGNAYLSEPFDKEDDFNKKWIMSQAKKDGTDESIAKYDGKWKVEEPKDNAMDGDLGLVLKSKAKHHAVSSRLKRPFEFSGKPLVVQYEVKFQNGMECGGAYIKLLSRDSKLDLKNFQDKTPYTIMFGPDKCGMDHKLHFIFRHRNPKTGEYEEKHAKKPSKAIDTYFSDKKTHLYTLIVNPDNSFEMLVDNNLVNEGSLLEDVTPPVNPPKEIDDPDDKKPSDWDDREKIVDPDAKKPDDWDEDEPEMILDEFSEMPDGWLEDEKDLVPDPDAERPKDWDDEMDGEWEAPLIKNSKCENVPGCGKWEKPKIKNPKYKGKWKAPVIDNPNYKGVWTPRKIENPAYFEDNNPYKMTPIAALGLELWSMTDDIMFDNFIITDDRAVAETWSEESWNIKLAHEKGKSGRSVYDALLEVTNERPWIWAVILVVVVLPIVLLIAYCCMSKSQGGLFTSLRVAAEEHPWLWAVYIVVLLLPILLLTICLCPRSGPITPEKIAQHKKTDDDAPDDEEKETTEEEVGAGGDNSGSTTKKSKADLEAEEANEEVEEAEEEEEEATPEGDSSSPRRSSPRKRKARKE